MSPKPKTPDVAVEDLVHTILGKCWETDDEGNFVLPEHSLGWEIAAWCSYWLENEEAGPWEFTSEQLRFILWWYAIDQHGEFVYRVGVLQRLKGWGKDPLLAVICMIELCGPSRFSHWGEDGLPRGKRHPSAWVQVAAVARDQTANTTKCFQYLASERFKTEYQVEMGIEFIRAFGGRSTIEIMSNNFRKAEGNRVTFAVLNEALWVETPIPTPDGFVRMGDIRVGDVVYGKDGSPTPVTYVTEAEEGRACFMATLPNGESIVASEGHLWTSRVARSGAKPRVRTTLDMVTDGRQFMIPRAGVRSSAASVLPVDPYVLGAWLGDGSTGGCNITIGAEDREAMLAEFADRGVALHEVGTRREGVGRFSFSDKQGFGADMGGETARALRAMDCYRDKHIPAEYLAAGHEQRLELLRGLMDTDGTVSSDGYCQFVGTQRLADGVFELAASLGFLPFRRFVADERSRVGGYWNVHFLLEGENCFSLPRKRDRVKVKARREWVSVRFEETVSVPVRCIEVADERDRLYQAGASFVTHNTHHWVAGNGGPKMFDTVTDNATKGGNRYLSITNAYMPGEDSVAETQRAAYMDIFEGRAPDIGFLYDSVEADPRTPLTPEALRVVIPQIRGDAVWLNPEPIIAKIMQTNHNPARARRMWLNMIFADSDGLFQEADWKALQIGHEGEQLSEGEEIVLGFDGGKSDDATALVAIRVHDSFIFPLLIEERPPMFERDRYWEVDRDKVDRAVREAFEKYKVKAFFADVALWESYLALWAEEYGETVAVKASERNPFHWDMRGNVRRVTLANEFLMRSIFDKRLKHAGPVGPMKSLNAALRRHVLNARRRENVYGVSFGKESKDSPLKVDGYAALMLALQALNDYKQKGQRKKVRTGRGYFF